MDALSRLGQVSIERGSESFASAARLFSPKTRDSAAMLYASCRYCDDIIDGQALGFPDAERAVHAVTLGRTRPPCRRDGLWTRPHYQT